MLSTKAGFLNLHPLFDKRDGIAHAEAKVRVRQAGEWEIRLGHDGGAKLFVDRKPVAQQLERRNPGTPDRTVARVKLSKGVHTLQVALDTDHGQGWGFFLRFAVPMKKRKRGLKLVFPEAII